MSDGGILRKVDKVIRKKRFENIDVKVEDSVVYLNGKVSSWDDFVEIGSLIGVIKNIRGVVNRLEYPGEIRRERKKGNKEKSGEADVVIIGGGVTGCSIARELSKYNVKVILVEKEDDVACGATKANNAMVHSGIGEKVGTLKQKLCVKGHFMYEELAKELNVPFKRCGMLIILTKDSLSKLKIPQFLANFIAKRIIPFIVVRRGKKIGIPIKRVDREELMEKERYVTERALAAVSSPSYGVICPYFFTIALAENAIDNGVEFMLDTEVVDVTVENDGVKSVMTTKGTIDTRFVINAAGLYADEVAEMAGAREYTIHPKKGATLLFDKELGNYINRSMSLLRFPRAEHYKGGGIMVTVDSNIQWGPTIAECPEKEDTSVTAEDIEKIFESYTPLLPDFPKKSVITYFAGIRASTFTEDFFIEASKKVKGFIHVAGIQSPGLAAAPAVADMVVDILKNEGLTLKQRENFNPYRDKTTIFRDLDLKEKKRLIEKNPRYGKIMCRCEQVTEGEIVDAIHSKLPALSVDAIKRRTRAGMGRCQGGFCLPHVVEILSRETGIPIEKIQKNGKGSNLFVGKAKCLLGDKHDGN